MNWNKINITAVLEVLRELERTTPVLTPTQSIVYSDGIEEVTITYKRLKEDNSPQKASEQMDSKAEGVSGVQDSHIPEDTIQSKHKAEIDKDYAKEDLGVKQ